MAWRNLIEGHWRNILTKLFGNSLPWSDTFRRRFLKCPLLQCKAKQPRPLVAMFFLPINMPWMNLLKVHPGNISTKDLEIGCVLLEEKIFKVSIKAIYGKTALHLATKFLTNQHGFKESDTGSLKEHFHKYIQPTGLRGEFKKEIYMDQINLKEFWWGHREDAFCEVSFQLTHWLQRRCIALTRDKRRSL